MNLVLAIIVGGLFATAFYMLLRRNLFKIIIGLFLLGQAANLLIFTAGGLERGAPPLIPADTTQLVAPFADPLPQALILTAIVIGFGAQAFAIVLVKRLYTVTGSDDQDTINTTDT